MVWEITDVDVYLRAIFPTFFPEQGDRSIEPTLHNSLALFDRTRLKTSLAVLSLEPMELPAAL